MKWVFYISLLCAVADVILFQIGIDKGDDVMFSGVIFIPLIIGVIYTGISIYWINKKELADKKPVFAYLLLSPPLLYLFAHSVLLVLWVVNIFRQALH